MTSTARWYHGWNIVAVAVLAQIAANGLAINSMSLFLHGWSKDLHSPISQLLLAMVPLAAVAGLSAPMVGALADKYPARRLFAAGLAGITIFCLGISITTATWQIWALYGLVFPVSLTLCTSVTANAVVSRWFVRRLGVALGITAFGVGIAGALLPPLVATVMPAIGWRLLWRFAGLIIGLVVLPLVVWTVRDRPAERDGLYYLTGDGSGAVRHSHSFGASDLGWGDILKRRNFWLLVICFVPMVALHGAIQQNFVPIATSHGLGEKTGSLLLAVFSLSHVASTLAMGVVSDRFGNRLPFMGLAVVLMTGAAFVALGNNLETEVLGAALAGCAGGLWTLLPVAAALEFGANGVGRAFGAFMFFVPLNAFAPAIVARLQESTGSYAPGLLGLCAIVFLCAMPMLLFMREKRGGHATQAEKEAGSAEEAVNPIV